MELPLHFRAFCLLQTFAFSVLCAVGFSMPQPHDIVLPGSGPPDHLRRISAAG